VEKGRRGKEGEGGPASLLQISGSALGVGPVQTIGLQPVTIAY